MIHFVLTETKRRVLDDYLALQGAPLAPRFRLVTWESLARAESLPRGAWVLSDLDTLGPAGRVVAREAHRLLVDAGLPVLNDPDRTLGRFELLRTLYHEGINDFRAIRATDDPSDLAYPVFVRGADDHFGALGGLLESPEAVRRVVDRATDAGLDAADLIVVEFRDTSLPDGRYTKIGAYVVGDWVRPQHRMVGKGWMIKHTQSDFSEEIVRVEHRYVVENPHEEELRRIFRLAGVEYGRMDYSLDAQGHVRVWEINLCPILGRSRTAPSGHAPAHLQPLRQKTKDVFDPEMVAAFEALDPGGDRSPALPLDVPADVRDEAVAELAPPTGGEGLLDLIRARTYFGTRW